VASFRTGSDLRRENRPRSSCGSRHGCTRENRNPTRLAHHTLFFPSRAPMAARYAHSSEPGRQESGGHGEPAASWNGFGEAVKSGSITDLGRFGTLPAALGLLSRESQSCCNVQREDPRWRRRCTRTCIARRAVSLVRRGRITMRRERGRAASRRPGCSDSPVQLLRLFQTTWRDHGAGEPPSARGLRGASGSDR